MAYPASDLPCYHADRYTVYPFTTVTGREQCIAPKKNGQRCGFKVPLDELDEARDLFADAAGLHRGPDRLKAIERMVLLRCCGEAHRKKLDDRPLVLRDVASRYDAAIAVPAANMLLSPPLTPRTPRSNRATPIPSSPYRSSTPRYTLRSLGAPLPVKEGPFEPYQLKPDPVVRNVLTGSIPSKMSDFGFIYAFAWPKHPGFVKIGYSAVSATSRLTYWERCHPGLVVLHSVMVPYPKRMEDVIHAELHASRHTIPICTECIENKTHNEWFKISASLAKTTLDKWAAVTTRNPLYSAAGQLTDVWLQIMVGMEQAISAEALLSAWDAQEQRLAQARAQERREHEAREILQVQVRVTPATQTEARIHSSSPTNISPAEDLTATNNTESDPNQVPKSGEATTEVASAVVKDEEEQRSQAPIRVKRESLKREDSVMTPDPNPPATDAEEQDALDVILERFRTFMACVEG